MNYIIKDWSVDPVLALSFNPFSQVNELHGTKRVPCRRTENSFNPFSQVNELHDALYDDLFIEDTVVLIPSVRSMNYILHIIGGFL